MRRPTLLWLFAALAVCITVFAAEPAPSAQKSGGGVVLEQVSSLVVDRAATLFPDDVILAYSRQSPSARAIARVPVRDALQWRIFENSELLRAPVTLHVLRDGALIEVMLADGWMTMLVRSIASSTMLEAIDDRLLLAIATRDWRAADDAFSEALGALGSTPDLEQQALIALHGARAAMANHDWGVARQRLAAALATLPDSLLRVSLMEADNSCTGFLRDTRTAQRHLPEALTILAREAPHGLAHARLAAAFASLETLDNPGAALARAERATADARTACGRCSGLGVVLAWHGDVLSAVSQHVAARSAYAESVLIAQALTPGQFVLARRLLRYARALRRTGEPELAESRLREALAIMQAASVPQRELAPVFNALGVVGFELGDIKASQSWLEQSLAITRRLDPDGLEAASTLNNLAIAAMTVGDYITAEQHLQAGIRAMEREDHGLNLATFLSSRAQLEMQRGNDELAEPILERVRDIQIGINPNAESLGNTYIELAKLYLRGQRTQESADSWARAIAVFEKLPGDSFVLAKPLAEFGYAELALGHLDQAEHKFQRAFELFQIRAPDSLNSTIALQGAGETAFERRDYKRAHRLLNQALAIRRRDAPDTVGVAQSLHVLGRIARARRSSVEARALFCEAAEVLDRASLRSGGGDLGETRFRAQYANVYHDCLVATVDAGDPLAALSVNERSRARGFRRALEQRRLKLTLPRQQSALSALDINALAYEQALGGANDHELDATARANARARAGKLQHDRNALLVTVGAAVPALANVYVPGQLGIVALQARLPKDTTYLAYSLGESEAVVLALRNGSPAIARHIPLDRHTLSNRVRALRTLIDDQSTSTHQQYLQLADQLYRDLLAPVSSHLEGAKRLLISTDGILQDLPFAALWQAEKRQYLIETHALTFVDSLGIADHATLPPAQARKPANLLAVGDPGISNLMQPEISRRLRSTGAGTKTLPPLPAARREVLALAKRYPGRTRLLIGDAATEARVRAEAGSAGQVHFAVHALFDRLHPLDSALVLHPGKAGQADDDGLLQVWEIFEGVRFDVELVVLSACDTAAGKDFAGEGLLGFSRAFAFAGARATIASLWPVEDDSTAELMGHFYAARDVSHDEALALQRAMIEMIHRTERSTHSTSLRGVGGLALRAEMTARSTFPYHWAAFQLYGH